MEQGFKIRVIPLYKDNLCYYIYTDDNPDKGILVDVGHDSVADYCLENSIEPIAILSTHKHSDHTGGNLKMKTQF